MRFGAMNFPILPVLDELERIHTLNFDYMELAMDPPMAHYRVLWDIKKDLADALEKNAMDLVCHLPTFVFTADLTDSIRNASLEEMINSMETAQKIGAQKAVLHPCMATGMAQFVPETTRQHAMNSLTVIVEKADQIGLQLCFENMFPRFGTFFDVDDFVQLFERFPSLFMTLDIAHAHILDKEGNRMFKFLEQFKHRIAHLHISDNFGKKDEHLPLGKGSVPIDKFAQALARTGYNSTVTFEVFSDDTSNITNSRELFKTLFKC